MADTEHKHYHDDEFDPCCHFETYFGNNNVFSEDMLEDFMENVYNVLSTDSLKGDVLIDISCGLLTYQLFAAVDFFKDIFIIESSDCTIEETQKWIKGDPSAINKSHFAKFACSIKGQGTEWQEHEEKLRRAIRQVIKWDISQENPLGSVVLPPADCLISVGYLEIVCKDHEMFLNLLNEFSSLLKIGGHLILITAINFSYFTVGKHKFSTLKIDEKGLRKDLADTGFVIESSNKIERKLDSPMTDYEYLLCLLCCKEK
ncbi:hypothetical protein GDO86_014809 [Hymenochirus boettgeri]|uniref:Nicotinamide N-methyltransferase-like n=1 Tax=Hymenochirus boettgeri TaxID=247094 RepID=A0A8T2JU74_9PIPI|nr:hypothetical protein GDO86_014809 [Hymenochirus boettgeri]